MADKVMVSPKGNRIRFGTGFSWGTFLLGFWWPLIHGFWSLGGAMATVTIMLLFVASYTQDPQLSFVCRVLILVVNLVCAFKYSVWFESYLRRKGYSDA